MYTWCQRVTISRRTIMPVILDLYWTTMVRKGRIAAPLALRYTVPAAGTAAIFALSVGWDDARSVYGITIRFHFYIIIIHAIITTVSLVEISVTRHEKNYTGRQISIVLLNLKPQHYKRSTYNEH